MTTPQQTGRSERNVSARAGNGLAVGAAPAAAPRPGHKAMIEPSGVGVPPGWSLACVHARERKWWAFSSNPRGPVIDPLLTFIVWGSAGPSMTPEEAAGGAHEVHAAHT
jgi:hypothetical protein